MRDYQDEDWARYTVAPLLICAPRSAPTDDERLHALIGKLCLQSDRFRQLWARHDVSTIHKTTLRIRHPQLAFMELMVKKFQVAGSQQLEVLLLHDPPSTAWADALALLASSADRVVSSAHARVDVEF